jgi:hypothetical protein
VVDERLEIQLAHAPNPGSRFEINVRPALVHVRPIYKADFRIEIGSNFVAPGHKFQPVVLVRNISPNVGIAARNATGARDRPIALDHEIPEEDQPRI